MASPPVKTHEGQVPKTLEEVWDRSPKKLIVYVMEGVGLVRLKKGAGSPFVKLGYDKQKFKTSFQKNEVDPCWKELFFFEIIDDKAELKLEVWSHSTLGSDKMIGECNVGLPSTFPREHILDSWFDLKVKPGKKVVDPNAIVGNVHLRFYYSTVPETPPRLHFTQESTFHYQEFKGKYKTGDLIVYSGIGTTHSIVKSLSGSKYSRVGMVVELPNKYTQKKKLYILEISRNIENFLDAYDDKPICGVNLFRMSERLHAFYGTDIWWCPLKEPLEEIAKNNMIDWIWDIKKGKATIEYDDIPEEVAALMSRLELSSSRIGPLVQQELISTKFILNALRLGGRRVPSFNKNEIIYPVSVVAYQFFGDLIPLRVQNDATEVNEDPFQNVIHAPQLTSPEKTPEVVAAKEHVEAQEHVISPVVEEKKEVPKEDVKKVEQEPPKEEVKVAPKEEIKVVHNHHNKPLPAKPVVEEKPVPKEEVPVAHQNKPLPVKPEEKSPTPPAQTSPNVSQEVKVPELAVVPDPKKKDRSHRKTASNISASSPNDQVTKQRSSTISVVNVNQASPQDKEKIPAELAHLSPRGKKDSLKEKRSSKRLSKNTSKEKEKEKEKEKKDKLKEKEKVKASSDSLKKSLSDAKGLNDSKKKKSSKSNKEADTPKQSASVGSSLEVPAITIEPLPQKPVRPKSKSPTKVSPAVSNEFASSSTGASAPQTPSTSMEKSTLAPSAGVTPNGANIKVGASPKGSLEVEKTKTSNEQASSPNGSANQNGITFASKNNVKNNIFTKMDSEQGNGATNNAAAAPKPSPVKQSRPLPAQPKPALAKLAPPTLRPKADGEENGF
eukprot:TRINITY_DN2094_c0_g1_i1.p1 TRINITY_DN2094_c0_g1~~TRINITY_DN2094_c0_g1_i1.p1  ORF type:complete len:851 (-),score=215.87 TRINITY_DN2094_c0_g1_i1:61-2565(-)